MGEEAVLVHALRGRVAVELAQEEVRLLGERLEGAVQPVERAHERGRVPRPRCGDERPERVPDLDEHGGLKRARAPHRGLDLADRAVRCLAGGREPVEEAAAVEVLDARDRGRVVGALEVAPLGDRRSDRR